MNTEYHTIDGATFSATDATDLMTQLRQRQLQPGNRPASPTAAPPPGHPRCRPAKPHRPWPPNALVEDMLASGLIAIGKRHPEWGTTND